MKTAISIPDDLFQSADALAAEMGISRSELYRTAVAEYVAKRRDENITARLNEVYREAATRTLPRGSTRCIAKSQAGSLPN